MKVCLLCVGKIAALLQVGFVSGFVCLQMCCNVRLPNSGFELASSLKLQGVSKRVTPNVRVLLQVGNFIMSRPELLLGFVLKVEDKNFC
jgi:hypothetical protein